MDLARCLEDPARAQALFCWNINIAASNPQQGRLHEALRREDLLTVVIDLFSTDTTDFADYVLPAASFLEFDDLVASYFHLTLSAQVKAAEPMGDALPNMEIFRRLAKAMGYREPELYESDAKLIETVLQRSGVGEDFASLAAKAPFRLPRSRLCSSPTCGSRLRVGVSSSPRLGLRQTAFPACRSRSLTQGPQMGAFVCSRPLHRGS